MIYPVIGAPPSLIGGSHLSFTIFSDQSTISGSPGAAGASETFEKVSHKLSYSLLIITKIIKINDITLIDF